MSGEPQSPRRPIEIKDFARYERQIRYAAWSEESQRKLAASHVLVCGCGALGSVLASTLARAGVGHLRIVDRDFLELNNLQRQILFDEDDVSAGLPKAVAAQRKLLRVNSEIEIEALVEDVNHTNIGRLCAEIDVILDGTDNFETRFLVNDAAHCFGIPWVYGGCLGAEGQTMTVLPGRSACLRCVMREPPPSGAAPTCDTAGILASIVNVIASIQALEAMKIVSGAWDAVNPFLTVIDLWENQVRQLRVDALRDQGDCPTCRQGKYEWLSGERGSRWAVLCGRNAVQLSPTQPGGVSFEDLAARLDGTGRIQVNPFLLRFFTDDYVITVFPDGRAIVTGTDDPAVARSVHARYIGS